MKGLPSDCFSHGKGAKPKIVYVYESKTVNGVTQTRTRVKQVEYYVGDQLIDRYYYNYNAAGNISEYGALGQKTYWYDYDELGQLRQQIHFDANGWPVSDYFYSYDQNGNLLTKKKSGTVNGTYSYDNAAWKDQLTGYNGNGTFAYDANGNPLSYYNGSQYTFTWKDGRRLATASALGGYLSMSYSYNADGIRVSKNVNDIRHEYYLDGSRIIKETWADQTLEFLYDENNSVYCIVYTGGDGAGRYYLIKNLQGDVTRILNNNLETVAQYVYDPWGKLVNILDANGEPNSGISIANINPIRYRGYYFDMETGFYYLNARYYDPALGRFINPDDYVSTGQGLTSFNMYAYCNNDPINMIDLTGEFAALATVGGFGLANCWNPLGWAIGIATTSAAVLIGGVLIVDYVSKAFDDKSPSTPDDDNHDQSTDSQDNQRSLPIRGEPNSSQDLVVDDKIKQRRFYGPDGMADHDIDYFHEDRNNTHTFPHQHKWDWSNKGCPRSKPMPMDK